MSPGCWRWRVISSTSGSSADTCGRVGMVGMGSCHSGDCASALRANAQLCTRYAVGATRNSSALELCEASLRHFRTSGDSARVLARPPVPRRSRWMLGSKLTEAYLAEALAAFETRRCSVGRSVPAASCACLASSRRTRVTYSMPSVACVRSLRPNVRSRTNQARAAVCLLAAHGLGRCCPPGP